MMYHLGKHNQVKSEDVSQAFICRECGRLFCDSDSLMKHIIIHQDRLEEHRKEIGDGGFEDRATTAQCPRCIFGCNCLRVSVRRAKTQENLKHYYICEECNYITLTQQALEAHLHAAHQPRYRRMSHTEDSEAADHVHFQCKLDFFSYRDKEVSETPSEIEHRQSSCGDYKKFVYQSSNLKERAHLPHGSLKHGDIYNHKSKEKNFDHHAQLKCIGSRTKPKLFPSQWRIDKHKCLLVPVEQTDAATELTCVKEDDENNDCKALGSSKHTNGLTAPHVLPSASKLKSDQKFRQESKNGPRSGRLQAQEDRNSPSVRKKSTPLHKTTENVDCDILPSLSWGLRKHCADRGSEEGCEGRHDTSKATGRFLECRDNERNPYARRYFRNQSSHPLRDEDDGEEDCSDIEQLIIKEEHIETAVCNESAELPGSFSAGSFDSFPTSQAENKPCPYCPAMFESGVSLSNHVRGHLHRVGLSYNARHMVSPEQVVLRERQSQIHRRIPTGSRKMRRGQCDSENVDIQCKNTPAATLPCRMQASAHRRRTGISGEPGLDYKLKKPRPGLKQKIFTSLDTRTYTFTCRFCDLVFCGPLSVQEEWIKHLQRHLLQTSMPHSGMRMVEVLGLHPNIKTNMYSELMGTE
ncbi:zinc finger protein 644 [Melanotaenia boesemani]|uniref:zinc finger protein 644 n=1 Tax=Melanotaenia boesemani TaxID=1250792 RepID=UPI001C051477|nr:zinc finger protein 644 [Melanotaenia boesemani]XP_041861537.1 zinc finger protein 644 [Melanotaenia boesemani]XP_041861538.1 zinc finger protein 644 [Melanotaenia boesemani]